MSDDLETKEDRLEEFKKYNNSKELSVLCPVCEKSFTNKYSLSNHFLIRGYNNGTQFIDNDHEVYWKNEKKKKLQKHKENLKNKKYIKKCRRCGDTFEEDFEGKHRKQCPDCRIKYPPKKKKPQNEFKKYPCSRCGDLIKVKLNANNKICDQCRKKEKEIEVRENLLKPLKVNCLVCNETLDYYKKHIRDRVSRILCDECKNDPYRFKKHYKYYRVIHLLENTALTRREIKELLNLEMDYVREAAIEKFGKEWYEKRVSFIRKRAGPLHAKKLKEFFIELRKDKDKFNKWFEDRSLKCVPSELEKTFWRGLNEFKYLPNQWITIKINEQYERREIDVKVTINETGRKFAVLIDGEAFHGYQAYFKKSTVEDDVNTAKVLADMGYYTIRYSETEVKSGWANRHFEEKYKEFMKSSPKYYYRNWITDEEISHSV